jgi:hypothetical protein
MRLYKEGTAEGEFDGILGFLGPLLLGFIRSSERVELANIKRLAEATAHESRVDAPTRRVQMDRSLSEVGSSSWAARHLGLWGRWAGGSSNAKYPPSTVGDRRALEKRGRRAERGSDVSEKMNEVHAKRIWVDRSA